MSEPTARATGEAQADGTQSAPLGGWGRLYMLVIGVLMLDIVLLMWLTEHYR